jgi:hypothetical protein
VKRRERMREDERERWWRVGWMGGLPSSPDREREIKKKGRLPARR